MRIYKVFTDCLVDDCMCIWYVKARNTREAWFKGYTLAQKSPVADGGGVDVQRVKELPNGCVISL